MTLDAGLDWTRNWTERQKRELETNVPLTKDLFIISFFLRLEIFNLFVKLVDNLIVTLKIFNLSLFFI